MRIVGLGEGGRGIDVKMKKDTYEYSERSRVVECVRIEAGQDYAVFGKIARSNVNAPTPRSPRFSTIPQYSKTISGRLGYA